MKKGKAAAATPSIQRLKPGTYAWCSCGESKTQPFCDGAHKGSDFRPVIFKVANEKVYSLCNCKQTCEAPDCDGSHGDL